MSGAIWVDGWGCIKMAGGCEWSYMGIEGWGCIEMAGGSEWSYMGRWLGVYRNGWGQ